MNCCGGQMATHKPGLQGGKECLIEPNKWHHFLNSEKYSTCDTVLQKFLGVIGIIAVYLNYLDDKKYFQINMTLDKLKAIYRGRRNMAVQQNRKTKL